MELFKVYSLQDVTVAQAAGAYLWDYKGTKYLDLYGGHAVISIGHSHPHYINRITQQLKHIGFYSNSVHLPIQEELAQKLGRLSGCEDYHLFLCNSGAEANENALKLASFTTGRKKVIAFKGAFHGRTSGAVSITDNPGIQAPFNQGHEVMFLPLNDEEAFREAIGTDVAAVIIEGIQGLGGIHIPEPAFLQDVAEACKEARALLILDEVQSGYGRTGKFFAHQYAGLQPDLITVAKGMGNGFPVAAVLIHPSIQAKKGMLGTTFGGNPLACAAALAVLEVMEAENLLQKAADMGDYLLAALREMPGIRAVRGQGLMIGVDLPLPAAALRARLLEQHHILVGSAAGSYTIRLLPPMSISRTEADLFLKALKQELT